MCEKGQREAVELLSAGLLENGAELLHTVKRGRRVTIRGDQPDKLNPGALVRGGNRAICPARRCFVPNALHLPKIPRMAARALEVRLGSV